MASSHTRIRTSHADDYRIRLSGGFFSKSPMLLQENRRTIVALPSARCELLAGEDFLDITLTAMSKNYVAFLEDVVSDGLDDVARGEELKYQWVLQ